MIYPDRKRIRLQSYDYSQPGYYFVTICSFRKKCIFSQIIQKNQFSVTVLTQYGKIIQDQLLQLEKRYPAAKIDKYTIMPNHIHAIIHYQGGEISLSQMIGTYKSLSYRKCREFLNGEQLFQTSFYDHVIRNQEDYERIWNYIEGNPSRWNEDSLFSEE